MAILDQKRRFSSSPSRSQRVLHMGHRTLSGRILINLKPNVACEHVTFINQ